MHRQLKHLLSMAELPNVEIRILPLVSGHLIAPGSFNYLQFRQIHDVPLNDMVSLETLTGMEYVEVEEETHQYLLAFESLMDSALGTEETRELIASVASKKWA
jgi:hypothetical protein